MVEGRLVTFDDFDPLFIQSDRKLHSINFAMLLIWSRQNLIVSSTTLICNALYHDLIPRVKYFRPLEFLQSSLSRWREIDRTITFQRSHDPRQRNSNDFFKFFLENSFWSQKNKIPINQLILIKNSKYFVDNFLDKQEIKTKFRSDCQTKNKEIGKFPKKRKKFLNPKIPKHEATGNILWQPVLVTSG